MKKIAVYPGSFDPVTNGHIDIMKRASMIFDELIVAVFINPNKIHTFSMQERVDMLEAVTGEFANIKIDSFDGLLTDYAQKIKATAIIRGLRAVSDFEKEFQQALMYKKLNPEIEILYLMSNHEYGFLSSSLIKEVAALGGCVAGLVPEIVRVQLKKING